MWTGIWFYLQNTWKINTVHMLIPRNSSHWHAHQITELPDVLSTGVCRSHSDPMVATIILCQL